MSRRRSDRRRRSARVPDRPVEDIPFEEVWRRVMAGAVEEETQRLHSGLHEHRRVDEVTDALERATGRGLGPASYERPLTAPIRSGTLLPSAPIASRNVRISDLVAEPSWQMDYGQYVEPVVEPEPLDVLLGLVNKVAREARALGYQCTLEIGSDRNPYKPALLFEAWPEKGQDE